MCNAADFRAYVPVRNLAKRMCKPLASPQKNYHSTLQVFQKHGVLQYMCRHFSKASTRMPKTVFFLQTAQHVILITDDNLVPLLRMPDQERAPFPTMTNEERHLFSTNHERAPFLLFLANHKRYSYCRSIRKNHSYF